MENPWLAVILEGLASNGRNRRVYYCNGENWNECVGVTESGKKLPTWDCLGSWITWLSPWTSLLTPRFCDFMSGEWRAGGRVLRFTVKSGNQIVEPIASGQRPSANQERGILQMEATALLCSSGWRLRWLSTSAQSGPSAGFRLPKTPWKCWQPETTSSRNTLSRDSTSPSWSQSAWK